MARRAGAREVSGRRERRSTVTYTTEFGEVPQVL